MAEWVSGISTVGALLLGLSILKRNHANAEKSQIDQVGWVCVARDPLGVDHDKLQHGAGARVDRTSRR